MIGYNFNYICQKWKIWQVNLFFLKKEVKELSFHLKKLIFICNFKTNLNIGKKAHRGKL